MGVWVPVELTPQGEVTVVRYDPRKLCLEIEINNQKFWISGEASFQVMACLRPLASGRNSRQLPSSTSQRLKPAWQRSNYTRRRSSPLLPFEGLRLPPWFAPQ